MNKIMELANTVLSADRRGVRGGHRTETELAYSALQAEVTRVETEFAELRAKLEALEKQEPVAIIELVHQPLRMSMGQTWQADPQLEAHLIRPVECGDRLYLAAGAKP